MRRFLAILLSVGLAVATPALAQSASGEPIPRSYSESHFPRADPEKPADQFAREQAKADASAAACDRGDWTACADLGSAFERGEGRPQNRPVAELLYRKACFAADGEGCTRLGALLRYSEGESDRQLAAYFAERGCTLGSLAGCDTTAADLDIGILAPSDPKAADALRRSTCERGWAETCRTLAALLLAHERTLAEQNEGRALLDRQCRKGDARACDDAARHWEYLIAHDAREQMLAYQALGCDAGDAWACRARGRAELTSGRGPAERATALAYFDRACALLPHACGEAEQLREEPVLSQRCESGDGDACMTLAGLLESLGGPIEDRPRALALYETACNAGSHKFCFNAASLIKWMSRGAGETPEPVRLERYLDRACTAGSDAACEALAMELANGTVLPQDTVRAAALYVPLCEAGDSDACEFVQAHAATDPSAPLMLANAAFQPELTPEEAEAEERARLEKDERERAEDRARRCTTTTVVFDGVAFTDTICEAVTRAIGRGFAAARGSAPWQALLWRPEVLGNDELTLSERVLCGGSVVREGWILTAAHCLTDEGGIPILTGGHRVRLGLNNPLSDDGFSYPILKVIPHPDYRRNVLAFDVALVQYDTKRGVRGNRAAIPPARIRIDPLPLNQRRVEALDRVVTYGWGVTKVNTGLIPDHLRGARLRLRDRAACTEATKFRDDKRRDSVLCADDNRGAEGGQACNGDSGGPLISYSVPDKVPTLIGVVSGGVECGTLGEPSRYIRVAHPRVQTWLRQNLPPDTWR